MNRAVVLEKVYKIYKKVPVVKKLSFTIELDKLEDIFVKVTGHQLN